MAYLKDLLVTGPSSFIEDIHGNDIYANNFIGIATKASALTNLNSNDNASNNDTWRKIWFSYSDGLTGRPALSDGLLYQTSSKKLKTGALHLTNTEAATTTTLSSQLIIGNSTNATGLELYRGSGASWQIIDESGNLNIKNNFKDNQAGSYYNDSAFVISHTTGNVTVGGGIYPRTAGSKTLGSNTAQWSGVFANYFYIKGGSTNSYNSITSNAATNIYFNVNNGNSNIIPLVITNTEVRRGINEDTINLGSSTYKWNALYTKNLQVPSSGMITATLPINITTGTNISATDNSTGILIIGSRTEVHLAIDNNEIQGRNYSNGTIANTLYLNYKGGEVQLGQDGTVKAGKTYLKLSGTTNGTMDENSTNPRIIFEDSVSDNGYQPVSIVYSDYDSYRSPAGLKIIGHSTSENNNITTSSPAWLEVEGALQTGGDITLETKNDAISPRLIFTKKQGAGYKWSFLDDVYGNLVLSSSSTSTTNWFTRLTFLNNGNININSSNNSTAVATGVVGSSNLIIGDSADKTVALELNRGTSAASWQLINHNGTFKIRNNWHGNSSNSTNYDIDALKIDFTSGNLTTSGAITAKGTSNYRGLILYKEGTSFESTTEASCLSTGIKFQFKHTTENKTYNSAFIGVVCASDYNGANMFINPGGNLYLGGGEGASNLYNAHKGVLDAETTPISENTYLLADSLIYVYSQCQTLANRIGFMINSSGHIIPQKAEGTNNNKQNLGISDNRWANIYTSQAKIGDYLTIGANGSGNDAKTISSSNTLYINSGNACSIIFQSNSNNIAWFDQGANYAFRPDSNQSRNLGTSSYRWGALYIGTANSYGATNTPIYWNNGVPTAITGALANNITGNAATASTTKALKTADIITGSNITSHADVIQQYFSANYSSVPRKSLLSFYSDKKSPGSQYFGYYIDSYNTNPHGSFFAMHYNDDPVYIGISNGTYTERTLLTDQYAYFDSSGNFLHRTNSGFSAQLGTTSNHWAALYANSVYTKSLKSNHTYTNSQDILQSNTGNTATIYSNYGNSNAETQIRLYSIYIKFLVNGTPFYAAGYGIAPWFQNATLTQNSNFGSYNTTISLTNKAFGATALPIQIKYQDGFTYIQITQFGTGFKIPAGGIKISMYVLEDL